MGGLSRLAKRRRAQEKQEITKPVIACFSSALPAATFRGLGNSATVNEELVLFTYIAYPRCP